MFVSFFQQLKAAGVQGHWMTPFPFTGIHTFQSLLWQHGGSLFNDEVTEATRPLTVTATVMLGLSAPDTSAMKCVGSRPDPR